MLISDLTLNEFVDSIPICQPETDLASVLQIFQQHDCQSVAIAKSEGQWGIVRSHRLLSVFSKSWQRLQLVMVNYPQHNSINQNNFAQLNSTAIANFEDLIEPVIVYPSDTSLPQFLSLLTSNSASLDFNLDILIIDSLGQLEGKLARDQLLKYLAVKHSTTAVTSQPSNSSNSSIEFLEQLTIPLKLADSSGKDIYLNPAWQRSISNTENLNTPTPETEVTPPVWWLNQQLNTGGLEVETTSTASNLDLNSPRKSSPVDDQTQPQTIILPSTLTEDRCVISCAIDNSQFHSSNETPLAMQIELGREWHYLKLPSFVQTEDLSAKQPIPCWLILGINSTLLDRFATIEKTESESNIQPLLQGIGHELKSPLTGILGLSSLLKEEKIGSLNQRQSLYLQLIYNSGHKLMKIANNLLELSSSISGNLELKPEAINLKSLCHQTYTEAISKLQLELNPESKSIATAFPLDLKIATGAEIAIVDPIRLSSILTHLIREAMQFSRPTEDSPLTIIIEKADGTTIIQVINELYQPADRVSTSESLASTQQSDGLNFMLAQYLVQTIQGRLQSTYTGGSCQFRLEIPTDHNLTSSSSFSIDRQPTEIQNDLTILCLYPEPEVIESQTDSHSSLEFNFKHWAEQEWFNKHRIIEADGLLQAHTLARIWQLDVIVLDGHQIANPQKYLRSLQNSEYLSALPIVTLDTKTTEAANQIAGLNVYPCLLPSECRSFKDLMQVIQIATGR